MNFHLCKGCWFLITAALLKLFKLYCSNYKLLQRNQFELKIKLLERNQFKLKIKLLEKNQFKLKVQTKDQDKGISLNSHSNCAATPVAPTCCVACCSYVLCCTLLLCVACPHTSHNPHMSCYHVSHHGYILCCTSLSLPRQKSRGSVQCQL